MVIILCWQDCPHHQRDHHANRADKHDWWAPQLLTEELKKGLVERLKESKAPLIIDQQLLVRVFDSDTIHYEDAKLDRYHIDDKCITLQADPVGFTSPDASITFVGQQ